MSEHRAFVPSVSAANRCGAACLRLRPHGVANPIVAFRVVFVHFANRSTAPAP